jgi:hypothetical protein
VKTNLEKLNALVIVDFGRGKFGTLENSNNLKAKLECTVYNSLGRQTLLNSTKFK